MCYQGLNKQVLQERKSNQIVKLAYEKTADAWDSMHGLRHGDRLSRAPLNQGGKRQRGGVQPNSWTLNGALQLGFRSFGKVLVQRAGIGGTTAAAAVTASLVVSCQQAAMAEQLISKLPGIYHCSSCLPSL